MSKFILLKCVATWYMLKEEYIYVFYGMHYLLKWWKDASGFASELSCFYLSLLAFVVGLFFSFSVLWVCGLASLCVWRQLNMFLVLLKQLFYLNNRISKRAGAVNVVWSVFSLPGLRNKFHSGKKWKLSYCQKFMRTF